MRFRIGWLLFEVNCVIISVQLHHTIALGICDVVSKYAGAAFLVDRAAQGLFDLMTIENIVAENQADAAIADKFFTYEKRLREPFGLWLLSIA